jgi:hypothetical protein
MCLLFNIQVSHNFLTIRNVGFFLTKCRRLWRREIWCKPCITSIKGWKILSTRSCYGATLLHISSTMLWLCCQDDTMARGGCVSRVRRNGSEGDTTSNKNSEWNHFLHSYRSKVAEWPTLQIHKTKHTWRTLKGYVHLIRIILVRHTSYNVDDLKAPSSAINK